ncbi:rnf217, partial [Symbiodinium pilosum]
AQRQAGEEAKRRRSQEENLLIFKLRSLCEQLGLASQASKQDLVDALAKHLEDEGYPVKRPKIEQAPEEAAPAPCQEEAESQVSASAAAADESAAEGATSQEVVPDVAASPEKALPASPTK